MNKSERVLYLLIVIADTASWNADLDVRVPFGLPFATFGSACAAILLGVAHLFLYRAGPIMMIFFVPIRIFLAKVNWNVSNEDV